MVPPAEQPAPAPAAPIKPAPIPEPVTPPAPIEPPAPAEPQPPSIVPFPKDSAAAIFDAQYRGFALASALKERFKKTQNFDKAINETQGKFNSAQSMERVKFAQQNRSLTPAFQGTQALENEGLKLFLLPSQRKRLLGIGDAAQLENEEKIRYEKYLSMRQDSNYLTNYLQQKTQSVWRAPIVNGQVMLAPAALSTPIMPPTPPTPPLPPMPTATAANFKPIGESTFVVDLAGPIDALVLGACEANGRLYAGRTWDTLADNDPVPAEFGYATGGVTPAMTITGPDGKTSYTTGINGRIAANTIFPQGTYLFDGGWKNQIQAGESVCLAVLKSGQIVQRLATQMPIPPTTLANFTYEGNGVFAADLTGAVDSLYIKQSNAGGDPNISWAVNTTQVFTIQKPNGTSQNTTSDNLPPNTIFAAGRHKFSWSGVISLPPGAYYSISVVRQGQLKRLVTQIPTPPPPPQVPPPSPSTERILRLTASVQSYKRGFSTIYECQWIDRLEANQGDKVTIRLSNPSSGSGMFSKGKTIAFAMQGYPEVKANVSPAGGASVTFVADKPGMFSFVCDGRTSSGSLYVKPLQPPPPNK
ncbi:MAG: hypothetical protein HY747_02840 [Elusimicrobia bacterium]|nr:hypothetical protein [Elusimicrobiota bacterium]